MAEWAALFASRHSTRCRSVRRHHTAHNCRCQVLFWRTARKAMQSSHSPPKGRIFTRIVHQAMSIPWEMAYLGLHCYRNRCENCTHKQSYVLQAGNLRMRVFLYRNVQQIKTNKTNIKALSMVFGSIWVKYYCNLGNSLKFDLNSIRGLSMLE